MKKVLIVDDDRLISKVLSEEFRDNGFEVSNAYNGEEGLEMARSEKPDLIMLDITMPKKDGISVLHDLKLSDDTKDIPVTVLTVSENESKLDEAIKLGASGAMLKSRHTLKDIVEKAGSYL